MSVEPATRFDHLVRMTDERGLFEHATGTTPRLDCGYCTDDNARLLQFAARLPDLEPMRTLSARALDFVLAALAADGSVHNRYGSDGDWRWLDEPTTDDWWGRAVGALGTAAAQHPSHETRRRARAGFELGATARSIWPHATAFALIGAADLLAADPESRSAQALVRDGLEQLGPAFQPWPESRLTYANATMPEALIAAGAAVGNDDALLTGLDRLDWLTQIQMRDGHLSVVGVGGRELHQRGIQFDQQPIEVGALADAAYRAWAVTGDLRWAEVVRLCAAWFAGHNDVGCVMYDAQSGGGYDGLKPNGPNVNQGAESTLAMLSTFQRLQALEPFASLTAMRAGAGRVG